MATTTVRDTQRERGYRIGSNNNSQRHPKREREQRLQTRRQQRQSETPEEREREQRLQTRRQQRQSETPEERERAEATD